MKPHTLKTYLSREDMAHEVAGLIARNMRSRIEASGIVRLAVPGGSTPGPMLEALGEAELNWDCVVVTLTDERWVPVSSHRSNQRLLRETLFKGQAAAAQFVPLYSGVPEPSLGMNTVCAGLEQSALPLDIAVLGMGVDMHTASLFPGAIGLSEALAPDAPTALVIKAPGAEEPRVTLSARALRPADRHFLIQGEDKRSAIERAAILNDPLKAPVCAILDGAIVHYAD